MTDEENTTKSTNSLDLRLDSERVSGTAQLGMARAWNMQRGSVYIGAGIQLSAGVNLKPREDGQISSPSAVPTYRDKISGVQANALLNEFATITGGSYSINDLPIGKALDLAKRYPAIVSEKTHQRADRLDRVIGMIGEVAQRAQQEFSQLQNSELFSLLPPSAQQGVLKLSAASVGRERLDAITVGQVHSAAKQIVDGIEARGGAAGMVAKVSQQVEKRTNVNGASATETLSREIDRLHQQAAEIVARVNQVDSPESIKSHHEYIKTIISYDPVLAAKAYVAAGGSYAIAPDKLHTTLGASYETGLYADADNGFMVRGAKEVKPSTISSSVVAVGLATHPAAGLPSDLVNKFGLSIPAGKTEFGVYASHQNSRETLMGTRVGDTAISTLAARAMTGLSSDGSYAYAEVSVEERKNALTPNAKGKEFVARIGITF